MEPGGQGENGDAGAAKLASALRWGQVHLPDRGPRRERQGVGGGRNGAVQRQEGDAGNIKESEAV